MGPPEGAAYPGEGSSDVSVSKAAQGLPLLHGFLSPQFQKTRRAGGPVGSGAAPAPLELRRDSEPRQAARRRGSSKGRRWDEEAGKEDEGKEDPG